MVWFFKNKVIIENSWSITIDWIIGKEVWNYQICFLGKYEERLGFSTKSIRSFKYMLIAFSLMHCISCGWYALACPNEADGKVFQCHANGWAKDWARRNSNPGKDLREMQVLNLYSTLSGKIFVRQTIRRAKFSSPNEKSITFARWKILPNKSKSVLLSQYMRDTSHLDKFWLSCWAKLCWAKFSSGEIFITLARQSFSQ